MFDSCRRMISNFGVDILVSSYGLPSLPKTTALGKDFECSSLSVKSCFEPEALANWENTLP